MQSLFGGRLGVPDWVDDVVPGWLAEVVRPKKAPIPWGTMARAVFALWVPLAVAFATGRRELALLPALGALLSITVDNGGPYWDRVRRIGTSAVCGGAPGLLIGMLIHGRGWVAVVAIVVVAGVSTIVTRLGGVGSITSLQLFVYSTLGLGPLGGLRPWWEIAAQWAVGVVWALLLITPGFLLAPRSVERKAVAAVYHALAADLRAIGTPGSSAARDAVTAALNEAYDAMLTGRAASSGRSRRDMHLMAVLNASHPIVEATSTLRVAGEKVPPWVTDTLDRLADAVLDGHGPGSGVLGLPGARVRARGSAGPGAGRPALGRWRLGRHRVRTGTEWLPMVPPQWSSSPGALELRDGLLTLEGVISGNWAATAPPAKPGSQDSPRFRARLRSRGIQLGEQLYGGRIAWEYTIRFMLCTGVAAVLSEVLPLQRSYWLVLTVGIILKPDFGSVFARALQRAIGTIVGAVLGAAILVIVPYGPWLLLPFGVLAALLPFAKARNFGLMATFLTPLVVLLIDLLTPVGWQLAEARLVDTVLASVVVLVVGYAPWPSAWQVHLPGQFAEAVRAVADYMDEALTTGAAGAGRPDGAAAAGALPAWPSRLRRNAGRALSNVRADFQRTMSEPPVVSRRTSAWYPAVVGLEEVMDAVIATAVAIGRGAEPPSPAAVHSLCGALRSVADAIETETPLRATVPLPSDPQLESVTAAVRSVVSMVTRGGGDEARGQAAQLAPA